MLKYQRVSISAILVFSWSKWKSKEQPQKDKNQILDQCLSVELTSLTKMEQVP